MDNNLEYSEKEKQVNNATVGGNTFTTPVKPVQQNVPQREVVTRVVHDNNTQTVVQRKVEVAEKQERKENKEAPCKKEKSACYCFGYNDTNASHWSEVVMNVWYNIMTAIWIIIGCFTFAPITFVAKKISVIFKKWVAVILSLLIYFTVLSIPVVIAVLRLKGIL